MVTMKKEKTTEEILAQIEIDKINARSTAKDICRAPADRKSVV